MRLASLNPLRPLRALAARAEARAKALRVDALSALGAAVHASESRLVTYLRGVESRITTAAEHREERMLARFDARCDAISAEIAAFRARHGFVGDPAAHSPAVGEAGERLVPLLGPTLDHHARATGIIARKDDRLPPGRPHP